ncbi:MAG: nitrite reductase, copper-containing [Acidobacteria bacterium]|nr:nitrite reductase, copper-containing [Acidobacteriota bacterium]
MLGFHRLVLAGIIAGSVLLPGCGLNAGAPESATASAPHVPPSIHRWSPAVVHVDLNASVRRIGITNGVLYEAWTFNDSVPGPFIRARVGDTLEVSVTNADPSGMPHNLDFHAVSGPGGGAIVTTVTPGQRHTARFALLYPGLFVYHCGAPPVMDHIANGMYGLMLVEPKGGLPAVDREYYVMQSEFYAGTPDPATGVAAYSHEAGLREDPTWVVFNGGALSLMGDDALTARTGETVRIYFGNAGPNKPSSFHIVGAVMDRVYREGDLVSPPARGVQTTLVPPGGAAVIDVKTSVPGTYTLLDHAIFRTEKGATGVLKVDGPLRPDLYRGDQPYEPSVVMRH